MLLLKVCAILEARRVRWIFKDTKDKTGNRGVKRVRMLEEALLRYVCRGWASGESVLAFE